MPKKRLVQSSVDDSLNDSNFPFLPRVTPELLLGFVSTTEFARIWGVSKITLWREKQRDKRRPAHQRIFPKSYRISRQKIGYRLADVKHFLDSLPVSDGKFNLPNI